jgi:capsid protein
MHDVATFGWVARGVASGARWRKDPADWLAAVGAPATAQRLSRKAAISGGTADTWGSPFVGDGRGVINSYLDSLQSRSVLARIIADNAVHRTPINRAIGFVATNATGWIVGNGAPIPLSKLALAKGALPPQTAAAMLVCSDELLADISSAGQAEFNRALSDAVALVVDQTFLDALLDDSDLTVIDASSDDDPYPIMQSAVNALGTPSRRALYWIAGERAATALACLGSSSGGPAFPAMSPSGGEACGLPVLVTDAVDQHDLLLLDASGLAADLADVSLRASNAPAIEMSDAPVNDASAPAAASMVSMFATDSTALLCLVTFGVEAIRPAVVKIQNAAWGETNSA